MIHYKLLVCIFSTTIINPDTILSRQLQSRDIKFTINAKRDLDCNICNFWVTGLLSRSLNLPDQVCRVLLNIECHRL